MDWIDNSPSVLRRIVGRPPIRNLLVNLATKANEKRILSFARDVDIVYLLKALSYPLVQALRRETKARVVYDIVDAMWLHEWRHTDQFHKVLRSVDAVTTDNEITADYIRPFNANCTIIPDAPQVEEFDKRRGVLEKKPDDKIILGWIGSPGTIYNLYVIWEALEELFRRHPRLHLRLVGTGRNLKLIPAFERVRFSCRPSYNQVEMIEEVFGMHIRPLPFTEYRQVPVTRGFKGRYLHERGGGCGHFPGRSSISEFIRDGVNGMIADSTQEWIDKLEMLISNEDLRLRLAQNGLESVRSSFRLDQSFAKLKDVLLATES